MDPLRAKDLRGWRLRKYSYLRAKNVRTGRTSRVYGAVPPDVALRQRIRIGVRDGFNLLKLLNALT